MAALTNAELGAALVGNTIAVGTKGKYDGKVVHCIEFFRKQFPEYYELNADGVEDLKWAEICNTEDGTLKMREFYAHISKKQLNVRKRKRDDDYIYVEPMEHQSFEHVSGYKSAIMNVYRTRRITVSTRYLQDQTDFFAGYKRRIGDEKQEGLRPLIEGKSPLPFSAYTYIAETALKQETDFQLAIFAHAFLLLSWNLIARCVNVSGLMFQHISWEGDAMRVVFPTTKTDQEGKNCSPKHVYANPLRPQICPILSFAIYFFTLGMRRDGSKCHLFGENTKGVENRFGRG